jgi:hypothetical protein
MQIETAKRQGNGSSKSKTGGRTTRLRKSIDNKGGDPQGQKERKYLIRIQDGFFSEQFKKMNIERGGIDSGKSLLKLKSLLGKEDEDFASYLMNSIPFIDMEFVARRMKMARDSKIGDMEYPSVTERFVDLCLICKSGLIRDFLLEHGLDVDLCWSDETAVKNFTDQVDTLLREHNSGGERDCKVCHPRGEQRKNPHANGSR